MPVHRLDGVLLRISYLRNSKVVLYYVKDLLVGIKRNDVRRAFNVKAS